MKRFMMIAVAAFAIATLFRLGAFAGELEQSHGQTVVRNQIEALKAGRDEEAYSYISPEFKTILPSVRAFMFMVKHAYGPLCAPQSYEFIRVHEKPGAMLQELSLIGAEGRAWHALFTLRLMPDGTWKISAIHLFLSKDTAT